MTDPNDNANYLEFKKESQIEFNEEFSQELIRKVKSREISPTQADKIWEDN